jgi:hypothetical protein
MNVEYCKWWAQSVARYGAQGIRAAASRLSCSGKAGSSEYEFRHGKACGPSIGAGRISW